MLQPFTNDHSDTSHATTANIAFQALLALAISAIAACWIL